MRLIRDLLDKAAPVFKEGGMLERFYPIYEATDTILFSTDERTGSGPHIRDSIDIKRVMILVVISLIPCYVFGALNIGYQKALTFGLNTTWYENLIAGNIIELKTGENLTEKTKQNERVSLINNLDTNGMIISF